MNEPDATIAICTHNGGNRLRDVIHCLASQKKSEFKWEILIVDNASTDSTKSIIEKIIRDSRLTIRSVFEEKLGITYARKRVAIESKGTIICFLDDDNFAEENFVNNALTFFENHPKCGIVGGKVSPIWEEEPSELVKRIANFALAICDRGEISFPYQGQHEGPVGAGMCIRRTLLKDIYDISNLQDNVSGRVGKKLESGEDIAFCFFSKNLGYECWYDPSLQISHFIPLKRMQKDYLLNLYEGIGRGQASVRKLYDWKARNPVLSIFIAIKDMIRFVYQQFKSSADPKKHSNFQLSKDIKDLNQRLLLGRICSTLTFFK